MFRQAKPGKLRVQDGDGFGSGLPGHDGSRGDCAPHGYEGEQGPAGALVASESSAATCSLQAELSRIFVEEDIGVVGRRMFPTPPSLWCET